MSLSEEPARKVFVKYCSNLISDSNSEHARHRKWILIAKDKPVHIALVWIQGIITSFSKSYDAITLDDGSGKAFIVSAKDAPGFGPWIQKGQYMMVIGEVLSVTPDVKVKAVKLTHLVDPNSETLWILEILDFWKFLEAT